jgi:4-amino-4-deoxychorismate lyase
MPSESPLRPGRYQDLELIETFRFEPGKGFIRLDRHLARLAESAKVLGFTFSLSVAKARLQDFSLAASTQRIRMTLNASGQINVSAQPFAPQADGAVWRLRIASVRLDSTNPLLRHKTSQRTIYERARAEFTINEADEVLLLNERGELCEGTITSLFLRTHEGKMLTPSIECGLLAGVLREEMLEEHNVICATLLLPDLLNAASILVGNSLRGLIRVKLE